MALYDFISIVPKTMIDTIDVQAKIEDVMTDELMITEHPVETGAQISDHAFKRPAQLMMRCAWSNSQSLFSSATAPVGQFSGGQMIDADYVSAIYSQLLALQESRALFDIVTSRRLYNNMQITSMRRTIDVRTSSSLIIELTCRQIIIALTQSTKLPAKYQAPTSPNVATPIPGSAPVLPQ